MPSSLSKHGGSSNEWHTSGGSMDTTPWQSRGSMTNKLNEHHELNAIRGDETHNNSLLHALDLKLTWGQLEETLKK